MPDCVPVLHYRTLWGKKIVLALYLAVRPTTPVLLYNPPVDAAHVPAYIRGFALLKARDGKMKGQVQSVYTRPFVLPPTFTSEQDYLRAGVWQLGKKVLDTILLAWPLVALAPGLK